MSKQAEIRQAEELAIKVLECLPEGTNPIRDSFALSRALAIVMVSGLGEPPTEEHYQKMLKAFRLHCDVVVEQLHFPETRKH